MSAPLSSLRKASASASCSPSPRREEDFEKGVWVVNLWRDDRRLPFRQLRYPDRIRTGMSVRMNTAVLR